MTVGKIDRMSEDEEDIDVSIIPMEHRTKHGLMSPMTRHVLKKSNFIFSSLKILYKGSGKKNRIFYDIESISFSTYPPYLIMT